MNRLAVLLLFAGWLPAAAQQAPRSFFVPVIDQSPQNSPVVISGSGILNDDPQQQSRYSGTAMLSVVNVSPKSIVLIVLRLRASNVPNMDVGRTLDDYFFSSELIEPGGDKVTEVNWPEFDEEGKCKPQLREEVQSAIHISVLLIQFSDGSILGNRKKAEEALDAREETIKRMAELELVYRGEGERALLDDLARPTTLAKIQQLQEFSEQTDDKNKVIAALVRLRAAADERGRAIKHDDAQALPASALTPSSSEQNPR